MTVESGAGARGGAARARRIAARYAERLERTVVGRWWSRLLEVEFVDRSVALAAKAFVSLFPLLIVISALTPDRVRREILQTLADRLGVDGQSRQAVSQAFAAPAARCRSCGAGGGPIPPNWFPVPNKENVSPLDGDVTPGPQHADTDRFPSASLPGSKVPPSGRTRPAGRCDECRNGV